MEKVNQRHCVVDYFGIYSHIQNGYLYDPENYPPEDPDAIRKFNELLNTD